MTRIIYMNGSWLPYAAARVHVEDRGFQFADGVYETSAVQRGSIIDIASHLERLKYSLAEVKIAPPVSLNVLPHLMKEAVARNHVKEGMVYLQITRGAARRDHVFPKAIRGSLTIIARAISERVSEKRQAGVQIITCLDQRWQRCDIKSINLLANVLARQYAVEQGADDAWLFDSSEKITESTASNAWIYQDGILRTHKADHAILYGITRTHILEIAAAHAIPIDENGFTRTEALEAKEAFISSSIDGIVWVRAIDGKSFAQGDLTIRLATALIGRQRAQGNEKTLA